ncbi:hypothetical protein DL98DRAFT_568743 [Cadophora sp. DSE1049]|nr:hypothetical protein DL98DRAFT_568743 [Cadophora sp. DSE1049]
MTVLKRKFQSSSSSSEDYDNDTGVSSIEYYFSQKDPYRAAPDGKHAIAWPYRVSRASQETRDVIAIIRSDYQNVLRKHNIEFHAESIHNLSPKHTSSTARDTLVIITRDNNPKSWIEAATDIQNSIDRQLGMKNTDRKIRVEIRNDLKMYQDRSFAVQPNSIEHSLLENAQSCVLAELQKMNVSQWTTIGCALRGENAQSGKKATIIVSIEPGTRSLWSYVDERLEAVLGPVAAENTDVDLYVEIAPGVLLPCVISDMADPPPRYYPELPVNPDSGMSIGPRGTKDAGTLGIWVWFRAAGQAQRQLAFLTCHHVVAPGDSVNRVVNDDQGIALQGRPILRQIVIDYPAPYDAAGTRSKLLGDLQRGPDKAEKAQKRIAEMERLISSGGFGRVLHSSGYSRRNADKHRMDWAIVAVNDEKFRGTNVAIARNRFSLNQLLGEWLEYDAKPGDVISDVGSVVEGSWAAKYGRTTAVTAGECTSLKAVCHWKDGTYTHENEVTTGDGTPFVNGGDSGSMIFNNKKEWIGMAIAGNLFEDAGYYTSAREILADITLQTGGTIDLV